MMIFSSVMRKFTIDHLFECIEENTMKSVFKTLSIICLLEYSTSNKNHLFQKRIFKLNGAVFIAFSV